MADARSYWQNRTPVRDAYAPKSTYSAVDWQSGPGQYRPCPKACGRLVPDVRDDFGKLPVCRRCLAIALSSCRKVVVDTTAKPATVDVRS
jgi:hypothetical protein